MPFDSTVNYLSHSVVAAEANGDPLFVLGAMLPDLANMARAKLPRLADSLLAAGVVFHERTDAAFHQCPTFIELNHEALQELRALGVSRGPARAAAHIGTEMLIDAAFAEDPTLIEPYFVALAAGGQPEVVWLPLAAAQVVEFRGMLAHLARGGADLHRPSKARFVTRLSHALAGRKRLAPNAEELPVMAEFCERYFGVVRGKLPRLLVELRARLFSTSNETDPKL